MGRSGCVGCTDSCTDSCTDGCTDGSTTSCPESGTADGHCPRCPEGATSLRRRERPLRRSKSLNVRFTDAELATVTAAGAAARLDAESYVAAAALAAGRRAARHVPVPASEAMDQLLALRRQLRAFEALVHSDAVCGAGASREVIRDAVRATARAIRRLDGATAALSDIGRVRHLRPDNTSHR